MEANKENIRRWNDKSRIPVPTGHLPALPKYLLQKKIHQTNNKVRVPLSSINNSPLPGPSTMRENKTKQKIPIKIDTKHVTVRHTNQELDWEHKIFKDDKNDGNDSVIVISDDDSCDENDKNCVYFTANDVRNSLGKVKRAITPIPKPSLLEPSGVRNVKRSLKRPHSRELQGLSPAAQPQKKGEENFKRRLNFNERSKDNQLKADYWRECYTKCIEKDYAVDLFSHLLSIERRGLFPRISSVTRACLLNWLMKVNGAESPEVIQTACWYFDSVLHSSTVGCEHLQVAAAACYWISQKLHGPVANASKLVKCSKNAFTCKQLMDVEKVILQILKYPPQPVIPQEYITYLTWRLDADQRSEIATAATFLCMTGMMVDKSLFTEMPSVIAAACVKNAIVLLRKRNLILELEESPIYQAAEKKATNMCAVCSALRKAVNIMASFSYEFKAPLDHYGQAPDFIAQKIVYYANQMAVLDNSCHDGPSKVIKK